MPPRKARKGRAAARKAGARAVYDAAAGRLEIDPIITMNSGGIIQSASESIQQVFGWTPEELLGQNVKVLIPEPPRSALDRYLDRYRNSNLASTSHRTSMFDAVRKDGRAIQIELSMSRADLPSQAPPYFIGIIRDVSKAIDVGADIASVRAKLQHLVTEQTRALATANLRLLLTDRLASLGTLAAGLGHDMNNVLLPIRARLNALEHTGISDAALEHVSALRQSIAYLQHLSEGLYFLASDPEGHSEAEAGDGSTDLAHWWRQVGELLRKAVPRRIELTTSFPAGLPPVRAAPHWLTQAMLNLLVNASEAMPKQQRKPHIEIEASVSEDNQSVRLEVTDNGRGMTVEVKRRAFDLFYTTKARGTGTGLGLPLVRKVALRTGGDVEIRTAIGRGTTVTLIMPVATVLPLARSGLAPKKRVAAISLRDLRATALVSQILGEAGFRVTDGTADGPGRASVWVTEPTPGSLAKAVVWQRSLAARAVVLLGPPPKRRRAAWERVDPTVIDPPGDFIAMRVAIGHAIQKLLRSNSKERNK